MAVKPWQSHILEGLFMSIVPVLLAILFSWPRIDTEIMTGGFEVTNIVTPHTQNLNNKHYARTEIRIPTSANKTESLAAWVYMPHHVRALIGQSSDSTQRVLPPVVVMAHGMGGQRDFGLHKYADRFAASGLAVVLFDYRTFGGSDGLPRHWVSPRRQLEDWKDVANFVLEDGLKGTVDQTRMLLWGTSFSGGHALVTAALLRNKVHGVVAQVPHLDGHAAAKKAFWTRGLLGTIRMIMAGVHDVVAHDFGFPAAYVKLAGKPGELAFMQLTDAELEAYHAKQPEIKQGGWQNMARAGLALELSGYAPNKWLKTIACPVFIVSATKDELCPPSAVKEAVKELQEKVTHQAYDVEHFQLYLGHVFEDVVTRSVEFLHKSAGDRPEYVPPPPEPELPPGEYAYPPPTHLP